MTMSPLVVDCFSGEVIKDWKAVYDSGIRGVIHKATEGGNYTDKTFVDRRDRARKAGLLWGAYHFLTNSDVEAQVEHFLDVVKPDDQTLLALDFEEYKSRTASLEQARQFLHLVFEKTGQRPVLYSGNLIKEQLRKPDAFFNQHRLWIAHYNQVPSLPAGWPHYWLHQYTGDGAGPPPHEVPGIDTRGIDLNVFGGTDLAAEWAPKGDVHVASMLVSQESRLETAEHGPAPAAAPAPEKVTMRERARVLQETIDLGSHLGTSIRSGVRAIYTMLFGTAAVGGTAATLLDPNQGTAHVATKALSPYPVIFVALFALMLGVAIAGGIAWWFFRGSANGLVTAVRNLRYLPPKQPTTATVSGTVADVSRETIPATQGA